MMGHDLAFRAASAVHDLKQPNCPCCGTTPFLPDIAEYAGEGCIRHIWVCEGCGHTYHTAVALRHNSKPVAN